MYHWCAFNYFFLFFITITLQQNVNKLQLKLQRFDYNTDALYGSLYRKAHTKAAHAKVVHIITAQLNKL